ncbi:aldehyde dehydrogenase family protein, partial [Candidatus Dependentiae bacterium]|nr:aldehyde dehydrogenase family protein [Candidatus Dependentiae bacterium]
MEEFQIYISGEWKSSDHYISVFNPYTGEEIARVAESSRKDFDLAVKSCELGFKKNRYLPAFQRAEILHKVSELLSQKEEEFAQVITNESGKAIKYSRGEVRRAVENLQFSAEAAKHVKGKVLVPDAAKGGIKHKLFYERFPLGIIAAITPFNFPLNLVVHKIAPAIAAGNSVLLKPSSLTPITSIKLIELFLEAGLPPHAVNLVIGRGDIVGDWITGNEKINMITFTGSPSVGKWIKNNSGMKKVSLELG